MTRSTTKHWPKESGQPDRAEVAGERKLSLAGLCYQQCLAPALTAWCLPIDTILLSNCPKFLLHPQNGLFLMRTSSQHRFGQRFTLLTPEKVLSEPFPYFGLQRLEWSPQKWAFPNTRKETPKEKGGTGA